MKIDGAGWDEAISRLGTHRILMMSRAKEERGQQTDSEREEAAGSELCFD